MMTNQIDTPESIKNTPNDSLESIKTNPETAAFELAARRDPYVTYDFSLFAGGKLGEKARTYLDMHTQAAWGIWQAARRVQPALVEPTNKKPWPQSTWTDGGHAAAECDPATCPICEKNYPDIVAEARKGLTHG